MKCQLHIEKQVNYVCNRQQYDIYTKLFRQSCSSLQPFVYQMNDVVSM